MLTFPGDDLAVLPERAEPIPWSEFRAMMVLLYKPPQCAKATASKMGSVLRELDALKIETTADLTPVLVARYVAARPPGQSPYTLHSVLAVVRTMCSYAETAGYLRCSPFRLRKLGRYVRLTPLGGKRHFSKEDIRRVIGVMEDDVRQRKGWAQWRARRLLFACRFVASTGLRRNEALCSQVDCLDLAAGVYFVRALPGRQLKTVASEQPVPLPKSFRPYAEEWLAHRLDAPQGYAIPADSPWLIPNVSRRGPWTGGPPGAKPLDRLRAVAKRAGVDDFTWQSLRRSLATHLEAEGLGEAAISRILRHVPGSDTARKHYQRADIPNLVSLVADLDF